MLSAGDLVILTQALFFIYVSYLLGDIFLRAARIIMGESRLGRAAYAVTLGYVFFGLVGLVLGLAGFFNAFYFRFFILVILASSLDVIASHCAILVSYARTPARLIPLLKNAYRAHTFLKILLTLWILTNLSLVFVPITGRDTLTFHLPAIKDIIQNERITFSPDIDDYYPWSPILGEILYASTAVTFNNRVHPFVFQVIQYSAMILLLALAYDFFRKHFANKIFLASLPLLILSIFEIQREVMHGGYVDVPLLLFGIAALFPILELWDKRIEWDARKIYLSALLAGAALGIKYNAFYFLAIAALFLLGACFYRKRRAREIIKIFAASVGIVLLVAGFWYGKNAAVFGNPVYPMMGIDGSRTIGETLIYERTIANFLLFPYNHFGSLSERDSSTKLITFYHFAAIGALFLFLVIFERKKIGILPPLLALFIGLYLGAIFFTSHHTRYFLGALFMLPPLFLLLCDRCYQYFKETLPSFLYRVIWGASVGVISLAFLVLFVGNIRYFYVKTLYKTGVLTEKEYILEIGGQ